MCNVFHVCSLLQDVCRPAARDAMVHEFISTNMCRCKFSRTIQEGAKSCVNERFWIIWSRSITESSLRFRMSRSLPRLESWRYERKDLDACRETWFRWTWSAPGSSTRPKPWCGAVRGQTFLRGMLSQDFREILEASIEVAEVGKDILKMLLKLT